MKLSKLKEEMQAGDNSHVYQLAATTEEGQMAAQRGKGQAFFFHLLYPSFLMTPKALILLTESLSHPIRTLEASDSLARHPTEITEASGEV